MDNLAVAYTINNVVFSELMTSTVTPTATEVVPSIPTTVTTTDVGTGMSSVEGVSEDDIDTMIEQGIGLSDLFNDNAIADSANSTSDRVRLTLCAVGGTFVGIWTRNLFWYHCQ